MITNMSVSLIICITLKFLESVCARVRACVRVCLFSYLVTVYLPNKQGASLTFTYCFVLLVRGL